MLEPSSLEGSRAVNSTVDSLKLSRVINAYETVSLLGGTRIRKVSLEAMAAVADSFVRLPELFKKSGERLAQLTRNEAAVFTPGAAAGLALSTLACIARDDVHVLDHPSAMASLERREVIVHRCQHTPYVVNVEQFGGKVVAIGYSHRTFPARHLEAAISTKTAAILYSTGKLFERYALPLPLVVDIAHATGVPVIVDAAAQLPPVENLWKFSGTGADLVVFSGGKGLQGPQDSGFVVGRTDLISTIRSLLSPHHGLGRIMKSSKEDVLGLLAAVEEFVTEDGDARFARLKVRAERLAEELSVASGIQAWVVEEGRHGQRYPRTVVRLKESNWNRQDFMRALRDGDPSIEVGDYDEDETAIYLNPIGLSEDEDMVVSRRILELLSGQSK